MMYTGINGEYFEVIDITSANCHVLKSSRSSELSLLWFQSDQNKLTIDAIEYEFNTNDIVSLTEFHKVSVDKINHLKLLRFNKPFYCILDHDSEVGCKGILYFGASRLPIIYPSKGDLDIISTAWKMLGIEMESSDNLQLEMLQMMLKRILILCTRIYKAQENYEQIEEKSDIIREFNYLVETYFRQKHSVAEYAELLFKSPKTLSNIFKKIGDKTPLHYISDRIMLEARRMLTYSDKGISDIAYELGYKDVQAFSRFFKKNEGISPNDFRIKKG